MYETLELYIDGQFRQGGEGRAQDVLNPATGKVLGQVPHAAKGDLDAALKSADKGFKAWRKVNTYRAGEDPA